MFGQKVWMKFRASSPFGECEQTLRNVTEIHYNYHVGLMGVCIAFESDILGTGCTYEMAYIKEFETSQETEQVETD